MHEDTRANTPRSLTSNITSPESRKLKCGLPKSTNVKVTELNPTLVRRLGSGFPTWNWLQIKAMSPLVSLQSTDIEPPAKRHPGSLQKIQDATGLINGNLSHQPQSPRKILDNNIFIF